MTFWGSDKRKALRSLNRHKREYTISFIYLIIGGNVYQRLYFMRKDDCFIPQCERSLYERYDKAVENNDTKELEWFAQFGSEKWMEQMIRNARLYEAYIKCGYSDKPRFDDHGWLVNGTYVEMKEKIEYIKVFEDNQYHAIIAILQHPNGKWSAGVNYSLSMSGGLSSPSMFNCPYNSRMEAINASLDKIIEIIERSDCNRDKGYLSKVRKQRGDRNQLSLFNF